MFFILLFRLPFSFCSSGGFVFLPLLGMPCCLMFSLCLASVQLCCFRFRCLPRILVLFFASPFFGAAHFPRAVSFIFCKARRKGKFVVQNISFLFFAPHAPRTGRLVDRALSTHAFFVWASEWFLVSLVSVLFSRGRVYFWWGSILLPFFSSLPSLTSPVPPSPFYSG